MTSKAFERVLKPPLEGRANSCFNCELNMDLVCTVLWGFSGNTNDFHSDAMCSSRDFNISSFHLILSYYYYAPVVFWWHLGVLCYLQNNDSFINESYKVTGHKTNIQKFVAFLYMNNEILAKKLRKQYIYLPLK